MWRAQDEAGELSLLADIDGVLGGTRDLVARLVALAMGYVAVVQTPAGGNDRASDARIGAAAAEVAGKRSSDIVLGRRRRAVRCAPIVMECRGRNNEARRAEPALQRIFGHESLLHGMQLMPANALDRCHSLARDMPDRRQATDHGLAVEQHRAGAAHARTAGLFRACRAGGTANDIDQRRVDRDVD